MHPRGVLWRVLFLVAFLLDASPAPVQPAQATSPVREPARSVALLRISPLETTCTGVLIDEQPVATNCHRIRFSLAFQQSKE